MNCSVLRSFCILLLLLTILLHATTSAGRDNYAPREVTLQHSDLVRLEQDLEDPEKRLSAISALATFSRWELYAIGSLRPWPSGDPQKDALVEEAARLARKHTDPATVSRALDSNDPELNLWSLRFWQKGMFDAVQLAGRSPLVLPEEGLTEHEKEWAVLIPKIQQLAKGSPYRTQAIDALSWTGRKAQREFLQSLIPQETNAGVILRILEYTVMEPSPGNAERDRQYNQSLLRLLTSPDVEIRRSNLGEIAWNWNSAEMWQVRFNREVTHRVRQLLRSEDAEERRIATMAIEGLKKLEQVRAEREHQAAVTIGK